MFLASLILHGTWSRQLEIAFRFQAQEELTDGFVVGGPSLQMLRDHMYILKLAIDRVGLQYSVGAA